MEATGRSLSLGTFEATVGAAERLCASYPNPRVLDVGCGRGDLLLALAPRLGRGCGVDLSPDAIRESRRRAAGHDHLSFHVATAESLPSALPGSFDLILFVGSLEHMADPLAALREARRRMHPDSRIMVVAIAPRAPHAVASRWLLRGSADPVVAHLGVDGLRPVADEAELEVEDTPPLYRGSRRTFRGRALGRLLRLYDGLGGPTRAAVLRRSGGAARHERGTAP